MDAGTREGQREASLRAGAAGSSRSVSRDPTELVASRARASALGRAEGAVRCGGAELGRRRLGLQPSPGWIVCL
ncbi:hypothetical protein NDU88_001202 [Pleurodeles waltl]|uniref:Uncharacterized protein n=1 Tax=Pleurodeles waltl TaxID=8319 RepID=A0AAV7P627_PLEWA|nr:hypothetical protein NDU88_001202 [Pleurodeles waltl]